MGSNTPHNTMFFYFMEFHTLDYKVIDYLIFGKPIVVYYTGYSSIINEADCGTYMPAGDMDSLKQKIARNNNVNEEQRCGVGTKGRSCLMEHRSYKKLAMNCLDIEVDA